MKRINWAFGLVAFIGLLVPVLVLAQDAGAATGDIVSVVVGALSTKWPIVSTIGSGLFLVSELLASNQKIAANSVYQLVSGWLKRGFGRG